jgi:phosphatidylglycerol:prolipoprotein diacylglycerol transferase
MISYPNIDPVAITIGPILGKEFPVYWYGIAYVCAFFAGLHYLKWAFNKYKVSQNTKKNPIADDIFIWIVVGIILGGRLGYTLFYNFSYFAENPMDILKTWQGGMSYHGGMLGVFIAILLFSWKRNMNFFQISDRLAPGVCIGLFFGRIANFINGELYGRATDVPWAMIFPAGGELPRHPSQLYEAGLEGLLLFTILHLTLSKKYLMCEVSGLFMIGYGMSRIIVEFFRQPDDLDHLKEGIFTVITMGQLLSIPMVLVGMFLLWYSRRHVAKTA